MKIQKDNKSNETKIRKKAYEVIRNMEIATNPFSEIPLDMAPLGSGYVNDDYIQRFLVNNLQHMLALGYWLDCIVFRSDSSLPLYIGVGSQIRKHKTARSKTIWWSGWKSRTNDNLHAGIYTQMQRKRHQRSKTLWWDGWKARAPAPAFIAVAGQVIKTQVWHSPVLWADKQTEEVHAGLTIGSKTITQATQSLTTE